MCLATIRTELQLDGLAASADYALSVCQLGKLLYTLGVSSQSLIVYTTAYFEKKDCGTQVQNTLKLENMSMH